ncbi:hypothetical protein PINS_up010813 [Pythium insidiosum]|nr:hypothetical protein PINS_up010813 [Pythium insidiosum]
MAVLQLQQSCSTMELEVQRHRTELERLASELDIAQRQAAECNERDQVTLLRVTRLQEQMCATRAFHAWSRFMFSGRARSNLVSIFARCRLRAFQREVFSEWKAVVQEKRKIIEAVETKFRSRENHCRREIVRHWQRVASVRASIHRRLRNFQGRRRLRLLRHGIATLIDFVRKVHTMAILTCGMERLLMHVGMKESFQRWKEQWQMHVRLSMRKSEKQRRLMAFVLGKEEFRLSKYFAIWKHTSSKRVLLRRTIERAFMVKVNHSLRKSWVSWCGFVTRRHQQERCLVKLLQLLHSNRLRRSYVLWMKHTALLQVAALSAHNEYLANQCDSVQKALADKTRLLNEVASTVHDLQDQVEAQGRASRESVLKAEQHAGELERKTQRQRILARIILHRSGSPFIAISRVLATSFSKWIRRVREMRQFEAALQHCECLTRKQIRRIAFMKWRDIFSMERRRVAFHSRRKKLCLFHSWRQWKSWLHERQDQRRLVVLRWVDKSRLRCLDKTVYMLTSTAFRMWKVQCERLRLEENIVTLKKAVEAAMASAVINHRQCILSKLSWQTYQDRLSCLRRWFDSHKGSMLRELRSSSQIAKQTLAKQETELEEMRISASTSTALIVSEALLHRLVQAMQALFRRLASAATAPELFDAISATFPSALPGTSAVFFLVDPTSNELWTTAGGSTEESAPVIRVPASLGIAGAAVSSATVIVVDDIRQDTRFHPLVDQLVLSKAGAASVPPYDVWSVMAPKDVAVETSSRVKSLFAIAVTSIDGSVYGVLEVAFPQVADTGSLGHGSRHLLSVQAQLLGKACCAYVEQLLHDMIRHSRDRLRARSPELFPRLFKQNKAWRKYLLQVDKQAQHTEVQLKQLAVEQDNLLQEKRRLHEAMRQWEEQQREFEQKRRATTNEQHLQHDELVRHAIASKKKLVKLKELVEAKELIIAEKTTQFEQAQEELSRLKQQLRAQQWQAVLSQPAKKADIRSEAVTRERLEGQENISKHRTEVNDASDSSGLPRDQLLRGADFATLKNQLVRAEADNVLLVKAVGVATTKRGELPSALKLEVNRITLRLKQRG